jgi:hypothetical protein
MIPELLWIFCFFLGATRLITGLACGHWINSNCRDLMRENFVVTALDSLFLVALIIGIIGALGIA